MRTRKIQNFIDSQGNNHRNVIWFGSSGKLPDVQIINVGDSFDDNQNAVRDSLIQKLSVLKNELWFNYQFGMPIEQKERSKLAIDSYIITAVEGQEGYRSIKSFVSKVENKNYTCDMTIETIYGDIQLKI